VEGTGESVGSKRWRPFLRRERGCYTLYVWTMYIVLLICCHQKAERERDREVVVVVVKGGRKEDLDIII
jgi:hypothetical protein